MSKISRIRILNLNYNNNSIKIDDETFDLGGESTLISLRNGGGKSVLVQMIISLFVNKTYRDLGNRLFKSYFTTNRPTFIMTEWQLDNNDGRFLAGMMVRKNQKEDNDTEELEMYTFTGSYTQACRYDLDNIPIVKMDGNRKILKGFSECRNLFEDIKKDRTGDFNFYDMTSKYGRSQYFSQLKQYQINNKEWESIIRKVNLKESGLSELFNNAKDEKNLIENWFLGPIEDKLNQDRNKIDEFRNLSFKFIEQYRANQSKIMRKSIIEEYFEDTKELSDDIDTYIQMQQDKNDSQAEIVIYAEMLDEVIHKLEEIIEKKKAELTGIDEEIICITYERISCQIYDLEDEKNEAVLDRIEQETQITRLSNVRDSLLRQINVYDCNKIYSEIKDLEAEKAEVDEKLNVILKTSAASKQEIEKIGHHLYNYYSEETQKSVEVKNINTDKLNQTQNNKSEMLSERKANENSIRNISGKIGSLENAVKNYDDIEDAFNREFGCDIRRNILGFYEDGALIVKRKEFDEEMQEEKNNLAKMSANKESYEIAARKLEQESEANTKDLADIRNRILKLESELSDLNRQKSYRQKVMKYVQVPEEDIDRTDIIISNIDDNIKQLDILRNDYITKKAESEKKYGQIKEGKTIELPDNIKEYFEENSIDIVYGMEWLTKNGRTVKENTDLVDKNPFLPYSIIMEKNTFERFKDVNEQLYTSFPIPIIIKDELENEVSSSQSNITTFDSIHFFIMFNNHLLDKAELEKMLTVIRDEIGKLDKAIVDKDKDLDIFREYRNEIKNQTFSTSVFDRTIKDIRNSKAEKEQLEERKISIKQEKDANDKAKKENAKCIEACKNTLVLFENRSREFEKLCKKYEQYETDKASLLRILKEKEELEKKQDELAERLNELENTIAGLNDLIRQCDISTKELMKKKALYEPYFGSDLLESDKELSVMQLEARFDALSKEVSETMAELQHRQKKINDRLVSKNRDLTKKNKYDIRKEEYQQLIYSDDLYDGLEKQLDDTSTQLNAANENNNRLTGRIEKLNVNIEFAMKDLKEKTGYDEPIVRENIVYTNFIERINLKKHDAAVLQKNIKNLETKNNELLVNASGVSEYADEAVDISEEKKVRIQNNIPDIENADNKVLMQYQKDIKRKLSSALSALKDYQSHLSEQIRNIASKDVYADDYFKKTFDSLLLQVSNPDNLKQQFEINKTSYTNQLEKLKIDLESIDNEQKNIEEMFLEYIESVNSNIGMIDKNSTINIRNRSIKMLKIQVPDWDSEKEHFRLKLHDYFENVIKLGLDTVEKNGNLNEFLGKVITTKKLYDDIVGINNVKIKMYKIEAEREVPITWAEVSANSGGEGFLSAFVILTCLLSYMRRDESDLFTTKEEGKVLIMDNPFAQTYSEHLLRPLMEMAKKTNTQLICLSGLGGDSIYNRFDNIYVLKLIDSNIRNSMQRIESSHIKGEPVKKLVLSEFKMEQVSMFDFISE